MYILVYTYNKKVWKAKHQNVSMFYFWVGDILVIFVLLLFSTFSLFPTITNIVCRILHDARDCRC